MDENVAKALWILGGYLIGGIPFGYLIGRMRGVDVRTVGSKNIGATNVYRTVGHTWGFLAFFCDVLKGLLPTLAVRHALPALDPVWVGLACVIGHTLTPYMKFKGGKGVATAFGMLLALIPWLVSVAFALFVVTVWLSHYISLGSMLAAAFLAVAIWVPTPLAAPTLPLKVVMTLLGVFVIYKHKSNIARLAKGCENKIY
ncbi:MAG: glycerol-3-phosphate 1-O-acyltransferase PlsY [Kiritimatiellia bacterium]